MGQTEIITKQANEYFQRYKKDRLIFPMGGSKKELDTLTQAMLYDTCVGRMINKPSNKFAGMRSRKQNLLIARRSVIHKYNKLRLNSQLSDKLNIDIRAPVPVKTSNRAKRIFRHSRDRAKLESILNEINNIDNEIRKLDSQEASRKERERIAEIKMMDVSVLETATGEKLFRRIHDSKVGTYPVPIAYDFNNFPIYAGGQKQLLAYVIRNGILSPWLTNRVKVVETTSGIKFLGELPFKIDETNNSSRYSRYYVEQTFRDSKYGLPITTYIGSLVEIVSNNVHVVIFLRRIWYLKHFDIRILR